MLALMKMSQNCEEFSSKWSKNIKRPFFGLVYFLIPMHVYIFFCKFSVSKPGRFSETDWKKYKLKDTQKGYFC